MEQQVAQRSASRGPRYRIPRNGIPDAKTSQLIFPSGIPFLSLSDQRKADIQSPVMQKNTPLSEN